MVENHERERIIIVKRGKRATVRKVNVFFVVVRSFRMISGEDSAKMKKSLVLVSFVRFANIFIMKELF